MSVKIEYRGKDVDDAINLACEKMNASRDQLSIEVISPGTAGIFGLCRKKAIIQVVKKDNDSKIEESSSEQNSLFENKGESLVPDHEKKSSQALNSIKKNANAAPSKSPSPEIADQIKELLVNFLDLMGFFSKVNINIDGTRVNAQIEGDNADKIIGREGSTIDAIQYLMRKIISQKFNEKIFFSLDSGDYRSTRKTQLEAQALEMAKAVIDTGKSRTTSALNPSERRIIHVTLQNDETIRSSSIGEGLFKKVRVYLPGKGRKKSSRRSRGSRSKNNRSSAARGQK